MVKLILPTSLHLLALSLTPTCVSSQTQAPTRSPVEFSNITVYNDGGTYTIDESISFSEEVIVVSQNTKLIVTEGGVITAPSNSEWPAIRLSVGSTLNATGGTITGSTASDGGEAIQLNNGQSSEKTAGYGQFYTGVKVVGGDGKTGYGGDALIVNGFGTEAVIYGGEFIGGSGVIADGDSVRVLNSAEVHILGGTFRGDMMVESKGVINLYGCFSIKNGTMVTGVFGDDTEISVNIRNDGSGSIDFETVPEQECDTAPSVAPTSFPTLSPQPTVVQSGNRMTTVSSVAVAVNLLILFHHFVML